MRCFPISRFVRATLLPCALLAATARAATIPLVVAQLADAYVATQAGLAPPGDIKETYARGFFVGFVNPDTDYGNQSGVEGQSMRDGQAWWKWHPEERDRVFAGYGYVRVMAEGTWTLGWEQNDFVPAGHADQVWTVDEVEASGGAGHDDWKHRNLRDVHVLVTGYVSSTGPVEQQGRHRRWMAATSIMRVPPFTRPQPSNLLPIPGGM